MALVSATSVGQFGPATGAVREGLAFVVACQFEAQRLLMGDMLYEYQIMLSDLADMWESLSSDILSIRRRCPAPFLN